MYKYKIVKIFSSIKISIENISTFNVNEQTIIDLELDDGNHLPCNSFK